MSLWKNLGRAYIIVSLVSVTLLIVKFFPVMQGKPTTELNTILSDLPQLEDALEHSPLRTAGAYMGLGVMYHQKQRFADAERMYRKALTLEPDNPDALFKLGVIYQEQKMWPEAAEAFVQSLKKKPDFSQTHNNLGLIYDELLRHEDALKEYEQAAKLEPDNPVLKENLRLSRRDIENLRNDALQLQQASQDPRSVQLAPQSAQVTSPSDMTIDVASPIADEPYAFRSPKRITLKSGRSVIGDIVEKDDETLWLEVGKNMRTKFSRDAVERIEDA